MLILIMQGKTVQLSGRIETRSLNVSDISLEFPHKAFQGIL